MSITNFFKKVPAANSTLEDESPAKKKAKIVELSNESGVVSEGKKDTDQGTTKNATSNETS
jgi:hypothetical protein